MVTALWAEFVRRRHLKLEHVKSNVLFSGNVTCERNQPMTATISDNTLALINQAETDLGSAKLLDSTAAASKDNVDKAEAQAAVDSANALTAHQTANLSATAAIDALKAELEQPPK